MKAMEKDKFQMERILEKDADEIPRDGCHNDSVPMIVHVRPDLYRAFMRCVWMLVYEEGMSPLEAQNRLVEEFLRHHGC